MFSCFRFLSAPVFAYRLFFVKLSAGCQPLSYDIMKKRKAIIDDGMNSELVAEARFDGIFEIPIVPEFPYDI